ncbi:MAG: TIGR01777 family protein [Verrucomicrobia bacterium]|nr:TIGR01777 family protein [Verrucomicrobiota bacterium]
MKPRRIILAGGSGFLGQALARHYLASGLEVVSLTRTPQPASSGVRQIAWDGRTLGLWARELEAAEAVINLAGRSVNCRYHERNRRVILESRLNPTRVLGEAINQCAKPPCVWLNSSTATIYKHNFGPAWDESGEIGGTPEAKDEFSVAVATAWEQAFDEAETPNTRKIALRSAMVLGHGANSVFPVLRRLVRCGLGGKMGSGRQYVSWIHQEDFCRAIDWLLQAEQFSGVVNLAAPNPVTNAEMMRTLREICVVPIGLPATRWMLEAGAFLLRTETELILKSRRVIPGCLAAGGFEFRFPILRRAFENLCGKRRSVALSPHPPSPAGPTPGEGEGRWGERAIQELKFP